MDKRLAYHADRFGLLMVDPQAFAIERKRHGAGHRICFSCGDKVADKALKKRIDALVIPPAWTDVKICVEESGHIQAIGRDEKGRLQYRYHDRWLDVRNAVKTERLLRFGRALPKLRRRIEKDIRRREVDVRATAATAARLVDLTAMRPGHEKYAEDGGIGVASLRKAHLKLSDTAARLKFIGKSKKPHEIDVTDRPLLRSLKKIRRTVGKRLFSFRGPSAGKPKALTATILNDYLREAAGAKVSAKDFRTFHGSAEALRHLIEEGLAAATTPAKRRRAVASAMRSVSDLLRNTPTVARASYVHPEIVTAFEEERLDEGLLKGRPRAGLTRTETGLMRFLEEVATKSGEPRPRASALSNRPRSDA